MLYSSGNSAWNMTTNAGATIQTALDWAMMFSPNTTNEQAYASELYPSVAAVASTYGDPDGKYQAYLQSKEPKYASEPFFLWDQPLSGGYNGSYSTSNGTTNNGTSSAMSGNSAVTGSRVGVETYWMFAAVAFIVPASKLFFDW